ncbi:hypothetical protein [Bacillus litorisediminis]|uniref:hypothetical protein n=1 Tax=Bacillus litorisediminis TaxID=2922713 RepID=UPI001FABB241|nr:hypothetical protein [Bacillus litorisediminis]
MRKLLVFFFTSIVSVPTIAYLFNDYSLPANLGLLGFISLYVIPLILLYGVPISIFSDKVTLKISGFIRFVCAFFIHLFFGFVFACLFALITDFSLLTPLNDPIDRFILLGASGTSIVFWLIDELLRYRYKKKDLLY